MTDQRESRLLWVAGAYLFFYALILTLSPAVREQTWSVPPRLSQWIGFIVWAVATFLAYRISIRKYPERDPYLLPLACLLSGWGLLTIWRLDSGLGFRQAIWLVVSLGAFCAVLYTPKNLDYLRRYKYLLLGGGLILTAMTLLMGTNPVGSGPRLWLGCCGFYMQPSEPLKLLLVVYLTAYLADRVSIRLRVFPLLVPTVFLTGLAFLLLVVQRDLGTASIFIFLYTAILYLATDKRRVLVATATALVLAALIGFFFIDIVHTRLEAWINPWNDPSGNSYQIVQSILAVANGGLFGRGPGLGSPSLVPVAASDFIFTAIAEETGLVGAVGLLALFGLVLARGLIAALRASDRFHRLLAAGITSYFGIQALLIIGGNIRLLPLTGETLPFVSYGGSSLLTGFVALALVVTISKPSERPPAALASPRPYYLMASLFSIGILAAVLAASWWAVIRGPDLLDRTDNPRLSIGDRYIRRGSLLDRNNLPIDVTQGTSGSFQRAYLYPELAPLTGYTQPTYGKAGLESSLDDYLRGLQGNPSSLIWWDRLVYGTPPPGLDVRLSLDLALQKESDDTLGDSKGAVVLMNAQSGEILVMASHPAYDPNKLDEIGAALSHDPNTPLINRSAQGMYPTGTATTPLIGMLGAAPTADQATSLYQALGFYSTPQLRMPVGTAVPAGSLQGLRVSPLQMAIAAATISNAGTRPAPRIALAVDTSQQGWVVLPALGTAVQALPASMTNQIAAQLATQNHAYWEWVGSAQTNNEYSTWYLAGTLPGWKGTPLSLVVLLEGNNPIAAQRKGQQLIQKAIGR